MATIYTAWRKGDPAMGPHLIDKLGRGVADLEREADGKDNGNRVRQELAGQKFYRPGQIGAMVADYKDHDVYTSLADKTQLEYRVYLDKFVDKFGDSLAASRARVAAIVAARVRRNERLGGHALSVSDDPCVLRQSPPLL